ncbi:uncharacterized protein LOC107047436, partial [Diachasma alloeum]|uniref:uncharacterized protein LOC107047436 n=1 Tax=Diachasma alloeum TaxID=454923 RepID=UPI0007384A21
MYSVNPAQQELFHLRLLLLTVKGATSYENLRKVNGELASSFTEACLKRGLISDDSEWYRALHEAEIWMMPLQMRRLFTRILVHCNPLYPEQVWDEFKIAMSEDFSREMDPMQREIKALRQIYTFLEDEGKNQADFPSMPSLIESDNRNHINEVDYDKIMEIGITQYKKLNEQQKIIIDTIIESINGLSSEKTFYIDGPGGSGKTFIYITLWHLLTGQKKKVNTMAFTGIAATLLPYGKTVHKTLGLPVPLYVDSTSTIKIGTKEANVLKETNIFIWDEAPMAPRYALEIMNRLLQDIMDNTLPFGGKIVILGGDFRQLLPVNIRGTRSETVNLSIKFSSLWPIFKIFKLTTNMRTLREEKEFSKFLLQVGTGDLNDEQDNLELPKFCTYNDDIDIAKDIYKDVLGKKKFKEASKYAVLAARNLDVNEINQQVVGLLDLATEHIYTSVD